MEHTDDLLAGRYRRVRPLGSGGMGDVWLADDVELGRQVAVKRLRFDAPGGMETELVERMMREARVVARLKHPAIVTLYDLVRVEGRPHLILEYVDGESLADRLLRERTADWRTVARVLADTAEALAAAHRAGVLHRDVKPGNVLVDPSGRGHLADFGIARGTDDVALTRVGEMVGTLAYLPPEAARQEPMSAASDVWSLGATFFAAVEGHPPFVTPGADVPAIIARLVRDDAPPPRAAGPCTALVTRMLATDPAARPTAAQVAAELERTLTGPAVLPATGDVLAPGPAPATERWAPQPVTADTAPHEAPTRHGGPDPTPSGPTGPTSPTSPTSGRGRRFAAVGAAVVLLAGAAVGVVLLQGGDGTDPDPAAGNGTPRATGSTDPGGGPGFTSVDVGPTPRVLGLADDGTGPLYVSNTDTDSVTVVDQATGSTTSIPVCDAPNPGTAVTPGGALAFIPCGTAEISVVDATSEVARIPLDAVANPLRLNEDGTVLYVPQRNGQLSIFDAESFDVLNAIGIGTSPGLVQLAPDGAGYTPDPASGVIVRIAPNLGDTQAVTVAANPTGLQVSDDGTKVYVTLEDGGVQVVERGQDGAEDTPGEVFALPGASTGKSFAGKIRQQPDSDLGWVPDPDGGVIWVLDLGSGDLVGTVEVGGEPGTIVNFSPDGATAYIPDYANEVIAAIDTDDFSVTPLEGAGDSPRTLTLTPDGSAMYVVGYADGDESRGTLTAVPLT